MRWTIVLPFFNEQAFLAATIESLLAQTRPCRIILVNNASTDASREIAARAVLRHAWHHVLIDQPRPGQVHALEAGLALVQTEMVAICDADTFYPASYLAQAEALLDHGDVVAACAWPRPPRGGGWRAWLSAAHRVGVARLLPWQNHVAGSSHAFCTAALDRVGGYSGQRWPYVLKDHELMARILAEGKQAFALDHWCCPSPRRVDRTAVRWSLAERLRYHLTPRQGQIAFFEDYLAPRLAARGMTDTVLRRQPWTGSVL